MNEKIFKRRVLITGSIIAVFALILVIRLFTLHFSSKIIVPPDSDFQPRRGTIKDRNGYILAMSVEVNSVFANPEEISDPSATARELAPMIKMDEKSLHSRLSRKKRFVWLKRKVEDETAQAIASANLRGIHLKKEYKRVYPHDRIASNIIGFVGIDNNGLDGIEYSMDPALSGSDQQGYDPVSSETSSGSGVRLTIDKFIQGIAEQEIEKAVISNRAKQGSAIVFEIKTGRVLALGKYPNFDPNEYERYSQFSRGNFSVINSFEPGSTLKIISLASMLEHDTNLLSRTSRCDGSVDIAETTINCTGVHGDLRMPDIIKYSCNVGMIKSAMHIKKEHLYGTLKKFNFGSRVSTEFPGESEGILRPSETWSGLSKYSITIGHEISVTSLQMAAAFGAIGNLGIYMSPAVIESIERDDGRVLRSFYPKSKGRVVSQDISKRLMEYMKGVVDKGTGKKAASKYYEVVGKTGTSQKYIMKAGAYSDRVIASFIGLAPYKNPEVCVLVVVDDPENKQSGGAIAAPAFAQIVDRVLPYMGVKGSYIQAKPPLKTRIDDDEFNGKTMPDLRGKRLSEAVRILISMNKKFSITYSISGTGRVYGQKPGPGAKVSSGEKITLIFRDGNKDASE